MFFVACAAVGIGGHHWMHAIAFAVAAGAILVHVDRVIEVGVAVAGETLRHRVRLTVVAHFAIINVMAHFACVMARTDELVAHPGFSDVRVALVASHATVFNVQSVVEVDGVVSRSDCEREQHQHADQQRQASEDSRTLSHGSPPRYQSPTEVQASPCGPRHTPVS